MTAVDTDDLIGVPWHEGGRDPRTGLDCLGVVLEVCRRMGLPAFDPWAQWQGAWRDGWRELEQAIPEGWARVPRGSALVPGDVLIVEDKGQPTHVVIVVGSRRVVSAMRGQGVVLLPQRWAEMQLHSAWRCEA